MLFRCGSLSLRRLSHVRAQPRFYVTSYDGIVVNSPIEMPELKDPLLKSKSLPHFLMKDFMNDDIKNRTAMIDGFSKKELTYKEVHDATFSFAESLRKHYSIKANDTVAIISPNDLHYFTVFIGVGLTGAKSTCINPMYTEAEILYQLEATNANVIVTHPLCLEKVKLVAAKRKNLSIILMGAEDEHVSTTSGMGVPSVSGLIEDSMTTFDTSSFATPSSFDPMESIYTIPFSSGTTGRSKGVLLTHYNIVSNLTQSIPFEGERDHILYTLYTLYTQYTLYTLYKL